MEYKNFGDWFTSTVFQKSSKRKYKKEVATLVVCVSLYVAFFVIMYKSNGMAIFDFIKRCIPFMELLEGTLLDIGGIFGLHIVEFGLETGAHTLVEAISEISISGFLIDLCKLELSSLIQALLFMLFSIAFLYGKDQGIFGMLEHSVSGDVYNNGFKFDILYWLNKTLLYGISLFVGTILGGYGINLYVEAVSDDASRELWSLLLLFLALYLIGCIVFMIRANKDYIKSFMSSASFKSKIKYSLSESIIKRFLCKLFPEFLKFFVSNLIFVYFFNCIFHLDLCAQTFVAFAIAILWWAFVKKIDDILSNIAFYNISFCGKYCPFSGFFLILTNLTTIALIYIMSVPNYPFPEGSVEEILFNLPFFDEWVAGTSISGLLLTDFNAYIIEFLNLVVICIVISLLQYLSSAFVGTLPTQVILRWMFILSFIMLIPIITNCVLVYLVPDWVAAIEYIYLAALVAVILFLIFVVLQPWIVVYSIVSAVCYVFIYDNLSYALLSFQRPAEEILMSYLMIAIGAIILNLAFALLENIFSCLEKKVFMGLEIVNPLKRKK